MRYADIVGAEDIVGGDENFNGRGPLEIGAASGGPRAVDLGAPKKMRQMPLGFPETDIAASGTATVSATTQVIFRGRRLIIPADIAASLMVTDLKVGKNSQLPSEDPLPGQVFSEDAVGVDLSLDTAQISQTISISLENLSVGPITFTATMLGDAAEY
jgi:hypothetical protein